MGKFKAKKRKKISKANLTLLILTICFAVTGIVCIFVGAYKEIVSWLLSFGIVLVVLALPVAVWLIRRILNKKVERM